jgi:hypothetical protein
MFIRARPLEKNVLAREVPRDDRSVHGGIVGTIVPVATGILDVIDANLFSVHCERFGDRGADHEWALTVAPDAEFAAICVEARHRCGWSD